MTDTFEESLKNYAFDDKELIRNLFTELIEKTKEKREKYDKEALLNYDKIKYICEENEKFKSIKDEKEIIKILLFLIIHYEYKYYQIHHTYNIELICFNFIRAIFDCDMQITVKNYEGGMNGCDEVNDSYYREYYFTFKDYILQVYRVYVIDCYNEEYFNPTTTVSIKYKGDKEFEQIVEISTLF